MTGVVVVGTGFGGRVVAPAFAAVEGCRVLDVVSARDDAAVARAIDRPDCTLVSVHSPPALHAHHVMQALDAGKSVLCDKPLTTSVTDSERITKAADARPGVHAVNFEFRFDPVRVAMRDAIAAGAVGSVEHIVWTHHTAGARNPLREAGWLFDRELGGGWIGAWASHAIDTLRFLAGEIATVQGSFPRTIVARRPDAHGVEHAATAEDALTASLMLSEGATVTLDSTFCAAVSTPPQVTVFGSEGVLENRADRRLTLRRTDGTSETLVDAGSSALGGDRHVDPMRAWARVLVEATATGDLPPGAPTFADGLAVDRVLAELRAG